jgi:hypothetical protein
MVIFVCLYSEVQVFSDFSDKRTSAVYMVPESGPGGISHKQHTHDNMNNSFCETEKNFPCNSGLISEVWETKLENKIPFALHNSIFAASFRVINGHDYLQQQLNRIGTKGFLMCPL